MKILRLMYVRILAVLMLTAAPCLARADQDSEKKKIYDKFEVVSFGQRQSFWQNVGRSLEGCGEWMGYDLDNKSVYEKRYEVLKLHWDDARTKFRENKVNTKTEPIYFGFIDWVHKDRPPTPPGLPRAPEVVTDHFVQFYVAARKKKKHPEIKESEIISLENRARSGLFLDIDGLKDAIMPLQKYTGFGGCDWALEDKGGGYFALKNRYSGKYLDISGRNFGEVMLAKYTPFKGCDWRFVRLENGYYKVVNRYWTEKKGKEIVLDINGKTHIPIVAEYTNFGGCDWKILDR